MLSKMATTFTVDTSEEIIEKLQTIQTKKVVGNETNIEYLLLNYDTSMVCNDDNMRGMYNAVVINSDTRKIMAIGPSKSNTLSKFKSLYGNVITNSNIINVHEMVEGLFFQLFWDERIEKWEISTRNSIGGNYSYYRMPHVESLTYRKMICESMNLSEDQDINDWNKLQEFDKNYCYHFVVQHQGNHMVWNIQSCALYIIGAFEMHFNNTDNQIRYVQPKELEPLFSDGSAFFPKKLEISHMMKYEDVLDKHVSIQEPSIRMGIVIQHLHTGDTTIAMNPAYEELQKLRGTHPNILFQYLCLKRIGKIEEFLQHFPQYKSMFYNFHSLFESVVIKLHQSYVDHFIQKKQEKIHKKYYYHIQQLHRNIYIPSLQEENKVIIKKPVVRKYLEELEPGHILHILQYELYGGADK
jgi:hypothetical protein